MKLLPDDFSVRFVRNPDGWWTTQVVEEPAAISQGYTPTEALGNVLSALMDLREAE